MRMDEKQRSQIDSLYNLSISAVIAVIKFHEKAIKYLPENIYFDICYELDRRHNISQLRCEYSQLDRLKKLLKVKDKESFLHKSFQSFMNWSLPLVKQNAETFETLCGARRRRSSVSAKNDTIKLGILIGRFLLDGGWYYESESVFVSCLSLYNARNMSNNLEKILWCHAQLLHVRSFCHKFEEAKQNYAEAQKCIEMMKEAECEGNFASVYGEFSYYFLDQYDYNEAYKWIMKALKEINSSTPTKDLVRILCIASRVCISKRKFKWSELLVKQALQIAKNRLSSRHLCYAAAMRCYGYYLLRMDAIAPAVKAYRVAMDVVESILDEKNLLVAKCHEKLAYAYYSYEYKSGQFEKASKHAEKSMTILRKLLKEYNPLFMNTKTVKALIQEEIGLHCYELCSQRLCIFRAEELHLEALDYALKTYGKFNLYTAKQYGNLGRVYQSLKQYKDAQDVLMKAIDIKEKILGPEDYEVGSSIGLLASLYTFDMELYTEAEPLFLKSVEISKRVFGEGYSGLQYDYKGLLRIYTKLNLDDKVSEYRLIFDNWKKIRDSTAEIESEFSPSKIESEFIAPENIMQCLLDLQL